MGQFFKFMFASCLGVTLALFALIFIFSIGIGSLVSKGDNETVQVKDNTILHITLDKTLPELTNNVETSVGEIFNKDKLPSIHNAISSIERAGNDAKIKGIFIQLTGISQGLTQIEALHNALMDFKKRGKFIYAYADSYSQGAYYIASTADSIFLNPNGAIDWKGFASQIPFFKDLSDRIGIKWQIYYAGQFKSATESLRLDKMSDQNKLQTRAYISTIYNNFLTDVSNARSIPVGTLQNYANTYACRTAHDALTTKMVDKLAYYDEVLQTLRAKTGLKTTDKVRVVSLEDYTNSFTPTVSDSKDKIAVIYAEGSIVEGNAETTKNGEIEGNRYAKIIRKLRTDATVKAIVLRINSGGGSAFASDVIWHELTLARQEGKVIVSSFGDVAASGGYYIAMASDSIFAEPNTITGSIGVFSVIPGLQNALKTKLGVSFDTVKTGKYAAGINLWYNINDDEGKLLQQSTDSIYEKFLNRVAVCRNKTRDQIHAVAQGRVWSMPQAIEMGLVDRTGNLETAINAAAAKAGLKTFKRAEYPKLKDPLNQLVEKYTKNKSSDDGLAAIKAFDKSTNSGFATYFYEMLTLNKMNNPQMRLVNTIKY